MRAGRSQTYQRRSLTLVWLKEIVLRSAPVEENGPMVVRKKGRLEEEQRLWTFEFHQRHRSKQRSFHPFPS
jgi:hypothetical protein